jgi:hypothetical protein
MTATESREQAALPRTERVDAPAYLQRYLERQSRGGKPHEIVDPDQSSTTPLYLRRFR